MNQKERKKIVIVGGTSTIAHHCARLWCSRHDCDIVLIARNQQKADIVANDLVARNLNTIVKISIMSFTDPNEIQLGVNKICSDFMPDIVLIAHGHLSIQSECEKSLQKNVDEMQINAISPALFAEAFASQLEKCGKGYLAVIGSVAGDRGRKTNYIYGASKAFLETYINGMQHRFYETNIRITMIKPGPTESNMTQHLKADGAKLADPKLVAKDIVDGINKKKTCIYTPSKWKYIMLIIKLLPSSIFNRLNI